MTWQQWTVAGILCFNLLMHFVLLYKEKTGQEAFTRVVAAIISPGVVLYALYSAGFWH